MPVKGKHLLHYVPHGINSNEFKSRVSPKQIINPEYWSPDYTLLTGYE